MGWVLLLATAFALRVAAGLQLGHFSNPYPWEYEGIADNLLAGNGYVLPFLGTDYRALCPPGYPFLCAAVYAVTHHSHTALLLLQCLLGALVCIPVRQIGMLALSNRACAVLGSWAMALHPGLIHYSSRLHTLTLDVLVYLLCLWAWLAFYRQPIRRFAATAGLASGTALLTRSTILPFLFLAALFSLRLRGQTLRSMAPKLGWILMITGLLMAPWLARNAAHFHRFPMLSSAPNLTFWIGNNPHATGGALLPDGRPVLAAAPESFLQELRQLDEMGQARLFGEQAREFVRQHPLQALRLFGRKLRSFFWFSPQTGIRYPAWHLRWYRWYYGVVAVLALLGLWTTRRRWLEPAFLLLFAYILSIAIGQALFFIEGRHRWTVEPLFLLFAAQGALSLMRWITPSRSPCVSS